MSRKNRAVQERSAILVHEADPASVKLQTSQAGTCTVGELPAIPALHLHCAETEKQVVDDHDEVATSEDQQACATASEDCSAPSETCADGSASTGAEKRTNGHEESSNSPAAIEQRQRPNSMPTKFGAYDIVWEIRRDALSTTYAARTEGIEKLLALRIFNVKLTDSALVRSIQKAASKTGELTHHNHVTIYDHGVGDCGAPYVVTDWIEGESLAETFQATKRMDIARFLGIFGQVCDALTEAHSRQLVHGNLSPHKIMLATNDYESDNIKLIDFGMPPDPVQNAYYLSPEQCLDRSKLDERTDIYSLGCIMYEALVGSPPFVGHKISQAALNYLHELANQYSPDSPEHNALKLLDCIIIKCLQKKPSKRFRNVRELTTALSLVNDCISGGNTRKLPPRADKLLLFRFLDFFDRKIWTGLFALFLFVGIQAKAVEEIQLQKAIDQAQLRPMESGDTLIGDWREALRIANLANKPANLKAELHWYLADAYRYQTTKSGTPDTNKLALNKKASAEYYAAYDYYKHGRWQRWEAMQLLDAVAQVNRDISFFQEQDASEHDVAVSTARKLIAQKRFIDADNVCMKYLEKYPYDRPISLLDARACNEAAMRMPAPQGIRYFERALHHSQVGGYSDYVLNNVSVSISQLGYVPTEPTHLYLGSEALKAGDLDAALGEFRVLNCPQTNNLLQSIGRMQALKQQSPYLYTAKSPDEAIEALTQLIKLKELAFGENSEALACTLADLGDCYRAKGDAAKAMIAYERGYSLSPDYFRYGNDGRALLLCDLYIQNGKADKACKFLEEILSISDDGQLDFSSPLFPELLHAYKAAHRQARLDSVVADATGAGEPQKKGWLPE